MKEIRRTEIATLYGRLASLCWSGDELVDFGGGIVRYSLDGSNKQKWGGFGESFDRAICCGDYAVTYESLGTKGIVLKGDQIVREINRSYYHAGTYEYPAAIFQWFDGQIVLAHCPEKYNRLEIEAIETGKRVVSRDSESLDFFHSRLQVSPDCHFLLSAGWVWQPWDCVAVFDLKAVAQNPELLDKNDLGIGCGAQAEETASAVFLNSREVIYSGPNTDGPQAKYFLGVHSLEGNRTTSEVEIEEAAGTMMPLGDHVITFLDHPRLREISTGKVICEWPDISSGKQYGSILQGYHPPPIALNPERRRFAVGSNERITVIELG